MKTPKEIKKARGITEIRKELTPDDCTGVRGLMQMFIRICNSNPDAVKAAMGLWARERADLGGTDMVAFYRDRAAYLAELFDYR